MTPERKDVHQREEALIDPMPGGFEVTTDPSMIDLFRIPAENEKDSDEDENTRAKSLIDDIIEETESE